MSGLWTLDEDWEEDDVPAWCPEIPVTDEQESDDEAWEEDDDLEEVVPF